MNVLPLPNEARQAIRDTTWPNRTAEAAATWDGDQAIFAKVRVMEGILADDGLKLAQTGQELVDAATEQLHTLAEFKMRVASGTVLMDQSAAQDFESAEVQAAKTIRDLTSLRGQIEHAIARCEDPMAALQSTLARFPALRVDRSYVK